MVAGVRLLKRTRSNQKIPYITPEGRQTQEDALSHNKVIVRGFGGGIISSVDMQLSWIQAAQVRRGLAPWRHAIFKVCILLDIALQLISSQQSYPYRFALCWSCHLPAVIGQGRQTPIRVSFQLPTLAPFWPLAGLSPVGRYAGNISLILVTSRLVNTGLSTP